MVDNFSRAHMSLGTLGPQISLKGLVKVKKLVTETSKISVEKKPKKDHQKFFFEQIDKYNFRGSIDKLIYKNLSICYTILGTTGLFHLKHRNRRRRPRHTKREPKQAGWSVGGGGGRLGRLFGVTSVALVFLRSCPRPTTTVLKIKYSLKRKELSIHRGWKISIFRYAYWYFFSTSLIFNRFPNDVST